jgi:hypothetical protein
VTGDAAVTRLPADVMTNAIIDAHVATARIRTKAYHCPEGSDMVVRFFDGTALNRRF